MGSISDSHARYQAVRGSDLLQRTAAMHAWLQNRVAKGEWSFWRSVESRSATRVSVTEQDGVTLSGLNFASQDYLGLNHHPLIRARVETALHEYGPHSAGSEAFMGSMGSGDILRSGLSLLLEMPHIVLFPTGWAAGYGVMKALVREHDHIILDELAHKCLISGAEAATRHVSVFGHNSTDSLKSTLQEIRSRDTENAILVATEALFSMDSDSPNLKAMQSICHEYSATFFVDVAHDLGALGPNGKGLCAEQGALGEIDLVMGSFSKTFCTNGGFLATRHHSVASFVRAYGVSNTFSNAMSPLQLAAAATALSVVQSEEGTDLRRTLLEGVSCLRKAFKNNGLTVLGTPECDYTSADRRRVVWPTSVPTGCGERHNHKFCRVSSRTSWKKSPPFPAITGSYWRKSRSMRVQPCKSI